MSEPRESAVVRRAIARVAAGFALCAALFGPLLLPIHQLGPDGHLGWLGDTAAVAQLGASDDSCASLDPVPCAVCAHLGASQRAATPAARVALPDPPQHATAILDEDVAAPRASPIGVAPARAPPFPV